MKLHKIEFICSSPTLKECPVTDIPEFAFIGRSNVGKSSLINMLTGIKGVAKVSGTPGKTRVINHFQVNSTIQGRRLTDWHLVDLPGYGFAKLSKTEREKFESTIKNYLLKREALALTFLLIDSRLEPQAIDLSFVNWMGINELAFIMIFTKTDKLTQAELNANIANWKEQLKTAWEELPAMVQTSAAKGRGKESILEIIENALIEIYLNSSNR